MANRRPRSTRVAAWLDRWSALLPLFGAEFVLYVGFGALLPVMPIYFTENGVDLALLGVVVAAWPAARLFTEPVFGVLADRTRRVPLLVTGLLVSGAGVGLSLVFVGAVPFLILRAVAGLGTAIYDPAARGYLADATPPERRGEAFGLYGASQMGGLLFGPAIGGFGAALFGGVEFVFVFSAVASLVAAITIALRMAERPHHARVSGVPVTSVTEFPGRGQRVESDAATDRDLRAEPAGQPRGPLSLFNRMLIAALILNFGGFFSGGVYEVIWTLFLTSRGGGLDLVGLTFGIFGGVVLLASPVAGRVVDKRGGYLFIVVGMLAIGAASFIYPLLATPILAVPVVGMEALGIAVSSPAIFAVVAAGSPHGRSSTAQGIYGAAGTLGSILASLLAGFLAAIDIRYPFFVVVGVIAVVLVVGLVVGGRQLRTLGHAPARG
ncbi:MAG: MFS transporter [Chloroflexota bacterium]